MTRFLSILFASFALFLQSGQSLHSQTTTTDLSNATSRFAAEEKKTQGQRDVIAARERLAEQALKLAQGNPTHPDAAELLKWILQLPYASPTASKAAELLSQHHGNSKSTILWLFGQSPREWTSKFLSESTHRELPAESTAILEVTTALHDRELLELSDRIKSTPGERQKYEQQLGKPLTQKLRQLDSETFEQQLIRSFLRIAKHYPKKKFGGATGRDLANGSIFAIKHLRLGKTATQLSGKTLNNLNIDLANYRGRVVLVDFWATWCAPCIADQPHLKKLKNRFRDQPFEILGVNTDRSRKTVARFVQKHSLNWPVILDPQGALQTRWANLYLPDYVVLDQEHRVRYRGGSFGQAASTVESLMGDDDPVPQLVQITLQQFDNNRDRRISRDELPADKKSILDTADKNKDGALSVSELTTFLRANLTTTTVEARTASP